MGNKYASGKKAFGFCDRCGIRVDLRKMQELVIKTKKVNLRVCPECFEPDHPQLQLGMYPVDDPQALRNPRPDNTYAQSGYTSTNSIGEGSRSIFWGWNPVGGGNQEVSDTPNPLVAAGYVGTVTVST